MTMWDQLHTEAAESSEISAERVLDVVFGVSERIRYVALYLGGVLTSAQRGGLIDSSSDESDRYEELLVNPVLLKLARQRGNIDCGGLRFVVVGYGRFHQLVLPIAKGHISICVELGANPLSVGEDVGNALRPGLIATVEVVWVNGVAGGNGSHIEGVCSLHARTSGTTGCDPRDVFQLSDVRLERALSVQLPKRVLRSSKA